jgi:hypothetical protein
VYIDLMRVFTRTCQCVHGGDAGVMSILSMTGAVGCVVGFPVCEVCCRCF